MTTGRQDSEEITYRKSTYSGGHNNCVEVGAAGRIIGVRDSKNRSAGALTATRMAWTAFVRGILS
ncbi:MAG TPA: DUF397 domain-containing protein [Streptosporangiaceae bacterium]|jgi:hypothetical protein